MILNRKLVLDTCAMRNKDLLDWIATRTSGEVSIPSVAYMELCRQILARKKSVDDLEKMLKQYHIKVLPFNKDTARLAAEYMNRNISVCPTCNKLDWTDTMIYASVGNPPTIFVTDNIDDFPSGNPDCIKTPQQVMQM